MRISDFVCNGTARNTRVTYAFLANSQVIGTYGTKLCADRDTLMLLKITIMNMIIMYVSIAYNTNALCRDSVMPVLDSLWLNCASIYNKSKTSSRTKIGYR